jgi:hypothetical protein
VQCPPDRQLQRGISPRLLAQPGDTFCYDDMIMRMATRYDATFGHI